MTWLTAINHKRKDLAHSNLKKAVAWEMIIAISREPLMLHLFPSIYLSSGKKNRLMIELHVQKFIRFYLLALQLNALLPFSMEHSRYWVYPSRLANLSLPVLYPLLAHPLRPEPGEPSRQKPMLVYSEPSARVSRPLSPGQLSVVKLLRGRISAARSAARTSGSSRRMHRRAAKSRARR